MGKSCMFRRGALSFFLICIVLSFSSLSFSAAPNPGDECGQPQISPLTERGIFIWKNCSTQQWSVIASADNRSSPVLNYEGVVSAGKSFESLSSFNLEAGDSIENLNSRAQIAFSLNSSKSDRDGFNFSFSQNKQACFNVTHLPNGTSVFLGTNKIRVNKSLNLQTLGDCYNFVFFLMDDMRWDSLWAMPITKEKLLTRGVNFSNAFITTPLCCPARANILSGGFYSFNTGVLQVASNIGSEKKFRENNDRKTIATKLQRAGYQTLYAGGKYLNGYEAPYIPPGWTKFVNNVLGPSSADWFDFEVVTGSSPYYRSTFGKISKVNQYVTTYHKDQLIDFMRNTDDSPFLAMFSVFAPHDPATPEKQDENRFLNYKYRGRGFEELDLRDKPQWVTDPDRARHVKSESRAAIENPLPDRFDECGKPEVDSTTDRGIFIWKNCVTDQWSVIATAGGQGLPGTTYEGSVNASQTFSSLTPVNIEYNDVVDSNSDFTQINFTVRMLGSGLDEFRFKYPADAQACFDVAGLPENSAVFIGSKKMTLNVSFNLTTLQPCYDDEFHIRQLQSLQSVDRAVGEIFDQVERQEKLDNTVFVFMSDHGYLWGEHGLYKKAMAYDEAIRTPLIFVMPGIEPRKDYKMIAADLDVPATILDMAGIKHQTDGDSMLSLLQNGNTPWKSELYFQHWGGSEAAFGTWTALRNKNYKYIKNALGEIELYDLKRDPYELKSLHRNPAKQDLVDRMDARLESQKGLAILSPWRAPTGKVGEAYNFQLTASGGLPPYTWSILAGELPPGLNLDPVTGLIYGTPFIAGTTKVKFMIKDNSIARHSGNSQYDVRPPGGFYIMKINN